MAKATTLTTLPNELLDAICACLPQSSLYALALTCKATKPSATAALYKIYTNHSHPADAPFHLFLRTICESPEHAVLVKGLDVRGWRSEHEVATGKAWRPMVKNPIEKVERSTYPGDQFVLTDFALAKMMNRFSTTATDDFDLFLKTAVNIGLVAMPAFTDHYTSLKLTDPTEESLKSDADLIRQLKHGVEDSHFILLLAQLPNLEKLVVDGLTPYGILDWHHFLSRVDTALQSLKGFHLWGSCVKSDVSSVQADRKVVKITLQIVDMLPNLELLQLVNISLQGHDYTGKETLPSKKLRKVSIKGSVVGHRLFKKITDGQHLQSFSYFFRRSILTTRPIDMISGKQLVAYLESSKSSLKTLGYFVATDLEHPAIRKCNNLQHLTIALPCASTLMRSSESLEVIKDRLERRLPSSLVRLTFSPLINVEAAILLVKAVATLKIGGHLPRLDVLVLKFVTPMSIQMIRCPFLSLDELKTGIGEDLAPMVTLAKLELKLEEFSEQGYMA